jgi:hypothetical protein
MVERMLRRITIMTGSKQYWEAKLGHRGAFATMRRQEG